MSRGEETDVLALQRPLAKETEFNVCWREVRFQTGSASVHSGRTFIFCFALFNSIKKYYFFLFINYYFIFLFSVTNNNNVPIHPHSKRLRVLCKLTSS